MYVIKANGEKEKFNPNKIKGSLKRAGASNELADKIVNEVKSQISNGESTRKILDLALKILKKKNPIVQARYDLKRAIMALGPTGFPFEKFFAEILKHYGYKVKVGTKEKGKFITHEIDVNAYSNNERYMVECKYHNGLGIYTSVKTGLYVYARFLDLKNKFDKPWLATNTKFSRDLRAYAKGVGMKVTSWEYPKNECLQKLIEDKKLYPITILKSVDKGVKERLSKANIVLARTLTEMNPKELKRKIKLPEKIFKKIIEEANGVCYKTHPEDEIKKKGLHRRH